MRVGEGEGILPFGMEGWCAGRSIQVIAAIGLFLMGVAYLSASFSPRQPQTVALDVGFSFLRIVLVLLGLFWVQELIAREVERRTVIFRSATLFRAAPTCWGVVRELRCSWLWRRSVLPCCSGA